jgi:hypothetical protein
MLTLRVKYSGRRAFAVLGVAILGLWSVISVQSLSGQESPAIQIVPTVPPPSQLPVRPLSKTPAPRQGFSLVDAPSIIRGEFRLGSIRQAFTNATIIVTLRRTIGPPTDAVAEKIAELHFFKISKNFKDENIFIPFTLGDFQPRPGASYSLDCYIDVNRNNRQDVGDYWNQRRVDVLSAEAPHIVAIEDFTPVVNAN